jgi:uncharacterized protein YkwD
MRLPIVLFVRFRWLQIALAWAVLSVAGVTARAEVNAQEQEIFNLLKNDSGQRRPFVTLDPILCQVARARAADMANRGYFDHTDPDGHGPNWWVEQAGYQLPATYEHTADANNIESASAGHASAGDTWDDWMSSPPHKEHLLAEASFYASQTSVGVGYVQRRGSDYTYYWVVLTAPPAWAAIGDQVARRRFGSKSTFRDGERNHLRQSGREQHPGAGGECGRDWRMDDCDWDRLVVGNCGWPCARRRTLCTLEVSMQPGPS